MKIVERFKVKKKLLGGYKVAYKCPYCFESLTSQESEIVDEEECPECGEVFKVAESALFMIESLKEQRELNKSLNEEMKANERWEQYQKEKAELYANEKQKMWERINHPSTDEGKLSQSRIENFTLLGVVFGGGLLVILCQIFLGSPNNTSSSNSDKVIIIESTEDKLRRAYDSQGIQYDEQMLREDARAVEDLYNEFGR